MHMTLHKLWETVKVREAWYAAVHGVTKSQTGLSNNKHTDKESIQFLKVIKSLSPVVKIFKHYPYFLPSVSMLMAVTMCLSLNPNMARTQAASNWLAGPWTQEACLASQFSGQRTGNKGSIAWKGSHPLAFKFITSCLRMTFGSLCAPLSPDLHTYSLC